MANNGLIIYKRGIGKIAHKRLSGGGDGGIAHKADAVARPGVTTISFSWTSEGSDLDICAYWNNCDTMKVGYSYAGSGTHTSGAFVIEYSGDVTSTGGTEWAKISKTSWGTGERFTIHFNFFGYNAETNPGNVCGVIASQENGDMFVKQDQLCSTNHNHEATTGDPSCVIEFDSTGRLIGIS